MGQCLSMSPQDIICRPAAAVWRCLGGLGASSSSSGGEWPGVLLIFELFPETRCRFKFRDVVLDFVGLLLALGIPTRVGSPFVVLSRVCRVTSSRASASRPLTAARPPHESCYPIASSATPAVAAADHLQDRCLGRGSGC